MNLPKLDYNYSELEPFIDGETMTIHHSKHHQAYLTKYVAAIEGTALEQKKVCEVLADLNSVPDTIKMAVRNNGGGHVNHALFWAIIGPNAGGNPVGDLATALVDTFGSFAAFKENFETEAANRFGSGWAWLVVDSSGSLSIQSTANQDSPIMEGLFPVLGLDVWEHAYYLNYQNRRPDYIKAFWNIVRWDRINSYYELAKSGNTSYLL